MKNFLRDLKITTRISLLVCLTLLPVGLVIEIGLRRINMIAEEVKAIAEEDIALMGSVNRITFHGLEQAIHLGRAIQFGKRMAQDEAAKDKFEIEKKNFVKHGRSITGEIEKMRGFTGQMCEKYKTTYRRKNRALQVDYELRSVSKERADYQFLAVRVLNLLSQGKFAEAEPIAQRITKEGVEEEHFALDRPFQGLTSAIEGFARDSIVRAEENKQAAVVGMILTSALVLFLSLSASSFISRGITKPLRTVADTANRIAGGERGIEIEVSSKNELGILADSFNKMTKELQRKTDNLNLVNQQLVANNQQLGTGQQQLRAANQRLESEITERKKVEEDLDKTDKKLVETARQADKAEVATDVLHNVGNVLNSINVTATLIRERVSKSEVHNLKKVVDIIKENIDDLATYFTQDQRGMHIPAFLFEVSKVLVEEQTDIIDKLRSLTENVEHVKETVKTQQSYAKMSGVEVIISLTELVENAIQINSAAIGRHGIRLVRDFADPGPINIDKQRLLQILVNLISNAKYAMVGSNEKEKVLIIRFYRHGADRVRIEVADNGVGIPQDNLTKIFSHGFTTKKDGHGFGLHSSVLVARELGGSLTTRSNGVGKGATFILELPFKPARVLQ